MTAKPTSGEGTAKSPHYYEGPVDTGGDVSQHYRFFSYKTKEGLVTGAEATLMFTLDRPAKDVWPIAQNFNLWQPNHHYSAGAGDLYSREARDLGQETFALSLDPKDLGPHRYQVLKVIPERLIVFYQPIPKDGKDPYFPGKVTVSPGFMVFMLNDHGGKTTMTIYMDHAFSTQDKTEEEALAFWRDPGMAPEWVRKWRDDFIPSLRKLVYKNK